MEEDNNNYNNNNIGHNGNMEYGHDKQPINFPPGYRFEPEDDELIVYYLRPKINKEELPAQVIHDINLYQKDNSESNPETLAATYEPQGRPNKWYFFTPRDRKYPKGSRPARDTRGGFWKATGASAEVKHKQTTVVGTKRSLVFYKGKPGEEVKTKWIMHEYEIHPSLVNVQDKHISNGMKLDKWVLCRIYENIKGSKTEDGEQEKQAYDTPQQEEILEPPELVHYNNFLQQEKKEGKNIVQCDTLKQEEKQKKKQFHNDTLQLKQHFHQDFVQQLPMIETNNNYQFCPAECSNQPQLSYSSMPWNFGVEPLGSEQLLQPLPSNVYGPNQYFTQEELSLCNQLQVPGVYENGFSFLGPGYDENCYNAWTPNQLDMASELDSVYQNYVQNNASQQCVLPAEENVDNNPTQVCASQAQDSFETGPSQPDVN